MDKLPLCLIGCGGIGHRHVFGFTELEKSGMGNIELVAVYAKISRKCPGGWLQRVTST